MRRSRATDPWTHGRAMLDDIGLHYVETGEWGDPLVLLLHGFPEFWYSWRHQLPALADAGFHAVAPDLRGYNRSAKPTDVSAYRMDRLVGDVAGLIEHFGHDAAHVVGHDWGGGVAWELAIRRPAVLESLTVLNMPHPAAYKRELLTPEQLGKSWYVLLFLLPRVAEWLFRYGDFALLDRLFRDGPVNSDAFTDRDIVRYKRAFGRPGALTAALDYYRALVPDFAARMVRESLDPRFDGPATSTVIEVPTLLLWGEQDPAVAVATTEGLDQWVPDIRIERLPETSHWVQNDAPDRVNERLVGFLTEES